MTDGPTEVAAPDRSETNRALVRRFFECVLVARQLDGPSAVAADLVQHDPTLSDGWEPWRAALLERRDGSPRTVFGRLRRRPRVRSCSR